MQICPKALNHLTNFSISQVSIALSFLEFFQHLYWTVQKQSLLFSELLIIIKVLYTYNWMKTWMFFDWYNLEALYSIYEVVQHPSLIFLIPFAESGRHTPLFLLSIFRLSSLFLARSFSPLNYTTSLHIAISLSHLQFSCRPWELISHRLLVLHSF